MKTTYTPTEAQTYLQLTPPLLDLLVHKYDLPAQADPHEPTVRCYCATDMERLKFELHRTRKPFVTLFNVDYAPDFGGQFCRMLTEAYAAPIAVVSVSKDMGPERLGAIVPGGREAHGWHVYDLPPAKAPSTDFLRAWEEWEQSLNQLSEAYAKVVLLVESEARLMDYLLLSSTSICLLLLPHLAPQVKKLMEDLQARLLVARRWQINRKWIDLTAMILVGTQDKAEGHRSWQRLPAEQSRVVFIPPDLRSADSFLRFWYTRNRAKALAR